MLSSIVKPFTDAAYNPGGAPLQQNELANTFAPFEDFFATMPWAAPVARGGALPIAMFETPEGLSVQVEVPGVPKENISVEIGGEFFE